jgi:hypothetical protein
MDVLAGRTLALFDMAHLLAGDTMWNARLFLNQLRSDKTGTRGAFDGTRQEAYSGANREPATAG